MANIGVCHLVRKANGPAVVTQFIESYKGRSSGVEHDLFILFKGFANDSIPVEYEEVLSSVNYKPLYLPDQSFDIGSYFEAAASVQNDYLCFLNSFSHILSEEWLAKLHGYAAQPQVGVVGASGSWESHVSNFRNALQGADPTPFSLRRLVGDQIRQRKLRGLERDFLPFPNYHLRTNVFMISRPLLLSLQRGRFEQKIDAENFESGKNGLTQQILGLGLRALVVGHDGEAYEKEQWGISQTFRSGNQENLLVADNRTRQYEGADESEKRKLQQTSWGGLESTL